MTTNKIAAIGQTLLPPLPIALGPGQVFLLPAGQGVVSAFGGRHAGLHGLHPLGPVPREPRAVHDPADVRLGAPDVAQHLARERASDLRFRRRHQLAPRQHDRRRGRRHRADRRHGPHERLQHRHRDPIGRRRHVEHDRGRRHQPDAANRRGRHALHPAPDRGLQPEPEPGLDAVHPAASDHHDHRGPDLGGDGDPTSAPATSVNRP
jgi:hypothetical protein